MATVYLGVGSNLGERQANIDRAISLLKEIEGFTIIAASTIIETRPVGGPPQEDFLNGVLKVETELMPLELLSKLKMIERRLGRVKSHENGPRPMDLDILFYDDVVIVDGKTLTIPHPKIVEREFVMKPLVEIAPEFIHPREGKSLQALYDENFSNLPNA